MRILNSNKNPKLQLYVMWEMSLEYIMESKSKTKYTQSIKSHRNNMLKSTLSGNWC